MILCSCDHHFGGNRISTCSKFGSLGLQLVSQYNNKAEKLYSVEDVIAEKDASFAGLN